MPDFSASPPQAGDVYSVVGDRYEFLVTGAMTGGALAMFSFTVPPHHGPPLHVHRQEDEIFHITEGVLDFTVDGRVIRVAAGETLHAPRGIPHTFTNAGEGPARAIVVVTPSGLENFFAEIGKRLDSRDSAPLEPVPDDIALLLAKAPEYGLEIRPPA